MGFLSNIRGEETDSGFDPRDAFVPANLPEPGEFLAGHELLTDREHVVFHRLTQEIFEERSVYDMTFGYNLARLNTDQRHPDAGFRYARDADHAGVLRAEFTPTTEFCPQSDTLTVGAFRAWNGLADRHEYDRVRVRVAPMHHQSRRINERLANLEEQFEADGAVPEPDDDRQPTDRPDAPF